MRSVTVCPLQKLLYGMENEMSNVQLEADFLKRLQDAFNKAHVLGYNTTTIQRMLETRGGVVLAKTLVVEGQIHGGLKALAKLGRKDLTIESIMLEPQFASLFSTQELDAAKFRLGQV